MEYYLALKKRRALLRSKTWMHVSDIILSERSQTQKRINYIILFRWGSKTGKVRRRLSLVRAPMRRGQQRTRSQGAENALYLDLGSGYLDVSVYKSHQAFSLRFVCFTVRKLYFQKKKKKWKAKWLIALVEANKRVLKTHLLSLYPLTPFTRPLEDPKGPWDTVWKDHETKPSLRTQKLWQYDSPLEFTLRYHPTGDSCFTHPASPSMVILSCPLPKAHMLPSGPKPPTHYSPSLSNTICFQHPRRPMQAYLLVVSTSSQGQPPRFESWLLTCGWMCFFFVRWG